MFSTFLILSVLLGILVPVRRASACSGLILGKDVSPTGKVLVAHNEDDSDRLLVRHALVPPRDHKPGTTFTCEEESAHIPQIPHTFGFFWSEVRGERGLSNADIFYNDHGVGIFSDSCRHIRSDHEPDCIAGGIGYGLRRALAEQAYSADHGVILAMKLLEQYGYRDSGRCYIIADANEAWMIQVVHGQHYCAVQIRDDEAAFIPNHYTIRKGDLNNRKFYCSKDLLNYASQKGWVSPHVLEEKDFDFAKAFQNPKRWRHKFNTFRQRHALSILTGREWGVNEELPMTVHPGKKIEFDKIKAIFRSHYEGTADDLRMDFSGFSPHYTPLRRICTGTTVEGIIAAFHEYPELTCLWIAPGRPCSHPYIPLHGGILSLPEGLSPIKRPIPALEEHCQPDMSLLDIDSKKWWNITQQQIITDLLYKDIHPSLQNWISFYEDSLMKQEEEIRQKAETLMLSGEKEEARTLLTAWGETISRQTAEKLEKFFAPFAPISLLTSATNIFKGDRSTELVVRFNLKGRHPVEKSILMGQGGLNHTLWATPIDQSLLEENGLWTLRFRVRELTEKALPCRSDFWLAGHDIEGKTFIARTIMQVYPQREDNTFLYNGK
ncbi:MULTISPECIES: C69 family dipeptidase [Aminobacterium]|uniref:C69 family dipeptidase n=1 Tax=Aminobacterium TaxID=81466 RepID=UPI00257B8EE5|nr:C69 family dipeptidase [Aminobacterium sp. UBA4834]